ncbi:MAG TPA: DUF2892 domain-containing protein [Verrucomicrobiota bacterium]|nr:DUF2892 domain-containing protein [Verrucomicrobiota bacterium]
MKRFFRPNIGTVGRLLRATGGLTLIVAGQIACRYGEWGLWSCVVGTIAGGFMLYEAARGWCVMRACGINTRI